MGLIVSHTIALLIAAIFVAIIARRIRLPYTVGLVITGTVLAFARLETEAALTHDFIFEVLLPPLLFEAALSLRWDELRRDAVPIVTLAGLGVVISAFVVAAGLVLILGWPLFSALVFGALIAATDPVAVIALFKDTGVHGRLRLLVESESLLNDGVAAVLFALVLGFALQPQTQHAAAISAFATLMTIAGGGAVVGLACGGLAILIAGRTSDHLVETALTAAAAYGSFLLAEYLHGSGILATVAAGLLMGNLGVLRDNPNERPMTSLGRQSVLAFWDFAAFVTNSLIFLLIGVTVAQIRFSTLGWRALLAAIGLVLLGRALSVYPICLGLGRSRWAVSLRQQHVLWWGGLRGALGLGLALSLPPTLPMRDEIVVATFGVVAFSVIGQGLTMPLLLRFLGLLPPEAAQPHPRAGSVPD